MEKDCDYCFHQIKITDEGDKIKYYCPSCGYLFYRQKMPFK